jgi:hypothetical protein
MWILSLLKAALTPLIACITVLIAYRQWQDSHLRLKRDNYDRCLKVYQEVVKMLQRINRDFDPDLNELLAFTAETAEAAFLFHDEIPTYINEIFKRGNKLQTANFIYRAGTGPSGPRDPDQYMKAIEEKDAQGLWFMNQLPEAMDKFKPYLHIAPKPWWKF